MSERFTRVRGVLGFAVRRTLARLRGDERTQILLSVAGVAIAVALLLLITSVGVGLSASETVRANNADYAIIPSGGSSAVTDVGRARLGRVHDTTQTLFAREDVAHATAVRTAFVPVRSATAMSGDDPTRLLVVGVTDTRADGVIAGLPTGALSREDVHYANGSYDGEFTGEMILSESASNRLTAPTGTVLEPDTRAADNRTFRVVAVTEPRRAGVGQFPVAIVHLSELQTVINATAADAANQIYVEADDSSVRSHLETVYPGTTVVSRGDLFAGADGRSRLPAAVALAAFVVALVVGTLFMITTMGFELAADQENRAVMRAIGVSGTSRTVILVVQTFVVAVAGGVAGVALWLLGIGVTNWLSESVGGVPVAAFRPILGAYGIGVALLIGLLTVPYLLIAARRRSMSEVAL